MMRIALLVMLCACVAPPSSTQGAADAGLSDAAPAQVLRCDPVEALAACDQGEGFDCTWGRLFEDRDDASAVAGLIGVSAGDWDTLLRALFPAIGDRPIVDEPPAVPEGLVVDISSFDEYPLPVPIDWAADPYADLTWRLYFNSLHWLPSDVTAGAAVVRDWVEHALPALPPLPATWGDHAISLRLKHVAALMDAYIATAATLDRSVLRAGAQVIVTHLYALAGAGCYAVRHNHGMSTDLTLLKLVRNYPALGAGDALWDLAEQRMLDQQVRLSVTSDGIHVENTGCYHLYYIEQLHGALTVYRDLGVSPPAALVEAADLMIEPLMHMLQPDLSFAQFGDCGDLVPWSRLDADLDRVRELGIGSAATLDQLAWAVSWGASGAPPAAVDRVYHEGGYAFFRDRWGFDAPAPASVHFKTSRLSGTHYHADETSFELFAHGHELIVGPGIYAYTPGPFRTYGRSPSAQNVLVVDDVDFFDASSTDQSRVVASGGTTDAPWVQGTHVNYASLGVSSLVRTLVFAKPDVVVIIDHVTAAGAHEYAQHFHLHPDLTSVTPAAANAVTAAVDQGPSLAIVAAAPPTSIDVRQGWHFPSFQVAVPASDVVLRHQRAAGHTDLAVVIVVSAPGQATRIPTGLAYGEGETEAVVSWTLDGVDRTITVPRR